MTFCQSLMSGGPRTYLFTNAASRIAAHTSRNETSFVNVCPCNTLGSARMVVDAVVQGVGNERLLSPSVVVDLVGTGDSTSDSCFFECDRWICGRNLCFFSSLASSLDSLFDFGGSPSQTSISMQRQLRSRTFLTSSAFHDCKFLSSLLS